MTSHRRRLGYLPWEGIQAKNRFAIRTAPGGGYNTVRPDRIKPSRQHDSRCIGLAGVSPAAASAAAPRSRHPCGGEKRGPPYLAALAMQFVVVPRRPSRPAVRRVGQAGAGRRGETSVLGRPGRLRPCARAESQTVVGPLYEDNHGPRDGYFGHDRYLALAVALRMRRLNQPE